LRVIDTSFLNLLPYLGDIAKTIASLGDIVYDILKIDADEIVDVYMEIAKKISTLKV